MISSDLRIRDDDGDRSATQSIAVPYARPKLEAPDAILPEFNLLVAGCRGGKTSFLRLLLDTSVISPLASKDQLASVAKFVHGCSGHTSYIRTVTVDINLDSDGIGQQKTLGLTLIDTPSLDFRDESTAERHLSDITRHIDSRFAEGLEDDWKAQTGDRYVHLCLYFLDPEQIVPQPVPGPPAPLIPRTRTNSFSQPDHEPVILEPPVTTTPQLSKLPTADVAAIRRLSGRVNVLPVIARGDLLPNDRLKAVKLAIRRDLAEDGIGFGIFDMDTPFAHAQDDHHLASTNRLDASNGYGHGLNGASSSNLNTSPPISPTSSPILRVPYSLISPDMYSHSDGVARRMPSRHELVQQYTPSTHYSVPSPFPRGKFIRSYRWVTLDVLDPSYSDFVSLRNAIFHHMETLQKYTKQYLFDKFRSELTNHQTASRHSISHLSHMPPMSHPSRPILAIDTAPTLHPHRHPIAVQQHRDVYPGDVRNASAPRTMSETAQPSRTAAAAAASAYPQQPRSVETHWPSSGVKQRTKKITVACNFCRSRKLKCDGGRPTCGQCLKRNNPCDYMPQNKRRTNQRPRKGDESGSETGDERSVEQDEPSMSPDLPSQPPSRRSSNLPHVGYPPPPPSSLPSISSISERRDDSSATSSSRPKLESSSSGMGSARSFFADTEVPLIATLPMNEPSPPTPAPMSAPTLPPLRPATDLQAAQRKRAATVPGKTNRQSTSSGPKVVACNFCRARKTKCDGAHPACASCARRQLDCNYVHDSSASNGSSKKTSRRPTTTKNPIAADSPGSISPPSSRMIPTPSTGNDGRDVEMHMHEEVELKRPLEYAAPDIRGQKKMRMDNSNAGIP